MVFKEPTYEEYKSATRYARFKYKFSYIILFLTWVSFLFVIYYMVINGEAIASNPLIYGADKFDVECICYNQNLKSFYVNGSTIWTIIKEPTYDGFNATAIKESLSKLNGTSRNN